MFIINTNLEASRKELKKQRPSAMSTNQATNSLDVRVHMFSAPTRINLWELWEA